MSNGILVVKTKNQCELCSISVPAQRPNARSKSRIWGAGPTPRPHHPPAHARPQPKSRKRTKPHRLQQVTPVPHRRHPVPSTPRPWRQPSHFSRILVSSSAAWARWGSRTRVEGILVKKSLRQFRGLEGLWGPPRPQMRAGPGIVDSATCEVWWARTSSRGRPDGTTGVG